MQSPENDQDCTGATQKKNYTAFPRNHNKIVYKRRLQNWFQPFAEIKDTQPFAFNCILIDLCQSRHLIMTNWIKNIKMWYTIHIKGRTNHINERLQWKEEHIVKLKRSMMHYIHVNGSWMLHREFEEWCSSRDKRFDPAIRTDRSVSERKAEAHLLRLLQLPQLPSQLLQVFL